MICSLLVETQEAYFSNHLTFLHPSENFYSDFHQNVPSPAGVAKALDSLQYVQNSGGRVLTRTTLWQHISPTLKQLHWHLVKSHVTHNILLFTIPTIPTCSPAPHTSPPALLPVKIAAVVWQGPACHPPAYEPLGIEPCVAAPTLWNSLSTPCPDTAVSQKASVHWGLWSLTL